jgi:hypothetical protein
MKNLMRQTMAMGAIVRGMGAIARGMGAIARSMGAIARGIMAREKYHWEVLSMINHSTAKI